MFEQLKMISQQLFGSDAYKTPTLDMSYSGMFWTLPNKWNCWHIIPSRHRPEYSPSPNSSFTSSAGVSRCGMGWLPAKFSRNGSAWICRLPAKFSRNGSSPDCDCSMDAEVILGTASETERCWQSLEGASETAAGEAGEAGEVGESGPSFDATFSSSFLSTSTTAIENVSFVVLISLFKTPQNNHQKHSHLCCGCLVP